MQVEILAKSYGSKAVLGKIAFRVDKGEVLAVTGPSGIGKSTLLRVIAGLDRDFFDGRVEGVGHLAMVFQEPTLLPWRTALDNLLIVTGCGLAAARTALREVGLADEEAAFPSALSLGQQRRLSLARAIVVEPDSLLLDEAFVSLDDETAWRMRALTLALLHRRQVASLLVTHDLAEVAMLADRVTYLDGAPASLLDIRSLETPRPERDRTALTQDLRAWIKRLRPPFPEGLP